ncbi:SLC13 family permease [Streptomyces sp. DHE17-7]|uniref:SLC13 family permease n=1 Tax=Streptomyces sp. DHE17-7 TaxID=2759949 RepID=UPI003FA7900F
MTLNLRLAAALCVALSLCALLAVPANFPALGGDARLTLAVFALATCAWIATPIDDTYIALGAGLALTATGVISSDTLFGTLGDDTVWLLICAFVLAAAVTRTGLAGRAAAFLVGGARSVRQLVHLTTAALVVTAFAVPATSGRAALALPVFLALAKALADRKRLVVMLALLFPTVILLSAVATLIARRRTITCRAVGTGPGEPGSAHPVALLSAQPLGGAVVATWTARLLLTTTAAATVRDRVPSHAEEIHGTCETPGPPAVDPGGEALRPAAGHGGGPVVQRTPAPGPARGGRADRRRRRLLPRAGHRTPQGRAEDRAVVAAAVHGGDHGDGRRARRLRRGEVAGVRAARGRRRPASSSGVDVRGEHPRAPVLQPARCTAPPSWCRW